MQVRRGRPNPCQRPRFIGQQIILRCHDTPSDVAAPSLLPRNWHCNCPCRSRQRRERWNDRPLGFRKREMEAWQVHVENRIHEEFHKFPLIPDKGPESHNTDQFPRGCRTAHDPTGNLGTPCKKPSRFLRGVNVAGHGRVCSDPFSPASANRTILTLKRVRRSVRSKGS